MKILDLQTGVIHEYGENCHDSLRISEDGRSLTYYNLQNGDGSSCGDYRFVMDDDKIPAESKTADALHGQSFFNIGGFKKREEHERPSGRWIHHKADGCFLPQMECSVCGASDILEGITPQRFREFYVYCWNCGAKMS